MQKVVKSEVQGVHAQAGDIGGEGIQRRGDMAEREQRKKTKSRRGALRDQKGKPGGGKPVY